MSKHRKSALHIGRCVAVASVLTISQGCDEENHQSTPSQPTPQAKTTLADQSGVQFEGQPFSYWYQRWADATSHGGEKARTQEKEAADAIRQMGTNLLPMLLKELRAAAVEGGKPSIAANSMFMLLGPIAAPAIPDLEAMIQDTNNIAARHPAYCLAVIGDPAIPSFTRLLADPNPEIRYCAAYDLSAELVFGNPLTRGTNLLPLIPPLLMCTKDDHPYTAMAAIQCLPAVDLQRAETEAALRQALQSTNRYVREEAANALSKLAPEVLTNTSPQ